MSVVPQKGDRCYEEKITALLMAMVTVLGFAGCARTIDDVIGTEPNFTGIVTEYHEDDYIVVKLNAGEYIATSCTVAVVPLEVEMSDSKTSFDVGDEVCVYHDDTYIQDKDSVKLNHVYAILLVNPADREKENVS